MIKVANFVLYFLIIVDSCDVCPILSKKTDWYLRINQAFMKNLDNFSA